MAVIKNGFAELFFEIIGYEQFSSGPDKDWLEYKAVIKENGKIVFPANPIFSTMYIQDLKILLDVFQKMLDGSKYERWYSTEIQCIEIMLINVPSPNLYEIWLLDSQYKWGYQAAGFLATKSELKSFLKDFKKEVKKYL